MAQSKRAPYGALCSRASLRSSKEEGRRYVEAEGASGARTAKDFKLERTRGGTRC